MAGKSRSFDHLKNIGTRPPDADTAPVPAPAPQAQPEMLTKRGRPPVDTVSMTLRLPTDLQKWLVEQAADQSVKAGRMISPQNVIVQLLEQARRA